MVVFSGGSLLGEPDRVAYFHFAESEGAMNEDIIRMAREAGWNEIGSDLWGATFDGAMSIYALSKFAELVRADEREACAKRLDAVGCDHCAANIRARGNE